MQRPFRYGSVHTSAVPKYRSSIEPLTNNALSEQFHFPSFSLFSNGCYNYFLTPSPSLRWHQTNRLTRLGWAENFQIAYFIPSLLLLLLSLSLSTIAIAIVITDLLRFSIHHHSIAKNSLIQIFNWSFSIPSTKLHNDVDVLILRLLFLFQQSHLATSSPSGILPIPPSSEGTYKMPSLLLNPIAV